jgi:hypothetical protein
VFLAYRLMTLYGGLFFNCTSSEGELVPPSSSSLFIPLPPTVVQEKLRDRAALAEFKRRYVKSKVPNINPQSPSATAATAVPHYLLAKPSRRPMIPAFAAAFGGDQMPDRVLSVLRSYEPVRHLI